MAAAADGPLSRAKADYWLGRVADARGDKAAAAKHYRRAAENPDTFHGLLAMQMLQPGRTSLDITPPAYPTAEQIRISYHSMRRKLWSWRRRPSFPELYTRSFLVALHAALPSEAEAGMVAHIAEGSAILRCRCGSAKSRWPRDRTC